jgi:type II secretory pathway pseudopilin PulG
LLVVIAIIGLLSSIVLASLSSAKERARLAKVLGFQGAVEKDLAISDIESNIAIFGFDDLSGTVSIIPNRQGNNYGGVATGDIIIDSGVGGGQSIFIDGNDYFTVDLPVILSSFTLSIFVKPHESASYVSYDTVFSTNLFRYQITFNNILQIRFNETGGGGVCSGGSIEKSKWSHTLVSYDGSYIRLYQDGELVGKCAKKGLLNMTSARIGIDGISGIGGTDYFDGNIDNVMFYTEAYTKE